MFSFPNILAAAGKALTAAAQHLEGSPAGQAVVTDAKQTLSDAANAAIGYVRAGATQQASDAASAALIKLGIPSTAATALAGFAVSQGEGFLGTLIPGV